MSDPRAPDEDLLEFLGGIDEVNDESQADDFADFLATHDIEKLVEAARQRTPIKGEDPKK